MPLVLIVYVVVDDVRGPIDRTTGAAENGPKTGGNIVVHQAGVMK